jgi:hypothetical protein
MEVFIMKRVLFAVVLGSTSFLSLTALGYPSFECKGKRTGKFYDAVILDVGDEDGEVVVNNGGAPLTFRANYRETKVGQHRWIFGYELFNEGIVPVLSELQITFKSGKNAVGKVSYFEHDEDNQAHALVKEGVTCKVSEE